MQVVELHERSPSLVRGSSTSTRNATRRSMPRMTGVSATWTDWLSRCRPSARIVPRAAALWPIVERVQVTVSIGPVLAAVVRLAATATSERVHRLPTLGNLVRGPRQLRAALAEQLLGGASAQGGDV